MARQNAWNKLCSNSHELGFDPKDSDLTFGSVRSKNSNSYTFELREGRKVIGEVEVDKSNGKAHVIENKSHKQEHDKEDKPGFFKRLFSRSERAHEADHNQDKHEPTGQYQLVRSRTISTRLNGSNFEMGDLQLVDPKGKVVFSADYTCGGNPNGRGAAPFQDARISQESEVATLIGGRVKTPALRLDARDTPGRSGILIHSGGLTSYGCLHISADKRAELFAMWDRLPDRAKGDYIIAREDHNPRHIAEARQELARHGIDLKEPGQRQYIASTDSGKGSHGRHS